MKFLISLLSFIIPAASYAAVITEDTSTDATIPVQAITANTSAGAGGGVVSLSNYRQGVAGKTISFRVGGNAWGANCIKSVSVFGAPLCMNWQYSAHVSGSAQISADGNTATVALRLDPYTAKGFNGSAISCGVFTAQTASKTYQGNCSVPISVYKPSMTVSIHIAADGAALGSSAYTLGPDAYSLVGTGDYQ